MNVQEVIEAGKQIVEPSSHLLDLPFGIHMSLITALVVLLLGLFLLSVWDGLLVIVLFAIMVVNVFHNAHLDNEKRNAYDQSVDVWKSEQAMPYIESLQKEKREIVFIKIDPEMSSSIRDGRYSYKQTKQLTPLTVSYVEDDSVVTKTDWYQTSMKLTNESSPYIEFQNLTEDLGHDVNKGVYNAVVYLPKSYKFTEIK